MVRCLECQTLENPKENEMFSLSDINSDKTSGLVAEMSCEIEYLFQITDPRGKCQPDYIPHHHYTPLFRVNNTMNVQSIIFWCRRHSVFELFIISFL